MQEAILPGLNPIRINAVLVGHIEPIGTGAHRSAIGKRPTDGPATIATTGIEGDQQADKRHHGGEEKAVHHYPFDHYGTWQSEYPQLAPALRRPGAFGENLSTIGLTEAEVCVGDVFQAGSATLQVSQGRQPCWKLNARFGLPTMAVLVQSTGRTGWYYRVLEPGAVSPHDRLELLERPHADWPLSRLLHLTFVDRLNIEGLREMAELEVLADSWRRLARRRIATGKVEDWHPRLATPT